MPWSSANSISLAVQAASSATIEVSDASLFAINGTGDLSIGLAGTGTLNVMNKGLVETNSLDLGSLIGSNGTVTIESLGELRVNNFLLVGVQGFGPGGDAKLTINDGSAQRGNGTGHTSISPKGVLEVLKGHFHEATELTVNGTFALDRTDGSASVGNNSVKFLGRLTIGSGGTLRGNGTIRSGNGTTRGKVSVIGSGSNQFVGRVLPGLSPGTLTIDADYEQLGGELGIEIGGTSPGQFDVLAVTGNATLGGNLLLEFIDGFAPRQGDVFPFLDIDGALTGAFDTIDIKNLMPGFQFDLRTEGGQLSIVALNDGVFVPEPATLASLLVGMLATLFRRHVRLPL